MCWTGRKMREDCSGQWLPYRPPWRRCFDNLVSSMKARAHWIPFEMWFEAAKHWAQWVATGEVRKKQKRKVCTQWYIMLLSVLCSSQRVTALHLRFNQQLYLSGYFSVWRSPSSLNQHDFESFAVNQKKRLWWYPWLLLVIEINTLVLEI